jgi:succinoglycan biosynthesis transport protein ExoP
MTFLAKPGRLRREVATLAVLAGCGLLGAALATEATTPEYRASTVLYLQVQPSGVVNELLVGSNFLKGQIESYSSIVSTPLVLQRVVDELDLNESAAVLSSSVTTVVPLNSTNLEIFITRESPSEAALIANSVSENFQSAMEELASGAESSSGSEVGITVLTPATAPLAPTSPNVVANLAMGLLTGIVAWFGVIVSVLIFDDKLRSRTEIARVAGAPVLGSLAVASRSDRSAVVARDRPTSSEAESFRTLRTNLQFLQSEFSARSFAVGSPNRGEGKSTVATNLAILFAESGANVVLVDANLRVPSIASKLQLSHRPGLTEVITGSVRLKDALQPFGSQRLTVLTSGALPPNPGQLVASDRMTEMIGTLKANFDVVIIDSPAFSIGLDAVLISKLAEHQIVVSTPQANARDLAAVVESLGRVGSKISGVVVNRESVASKHTA